MNKNIGFIGVGNMGTAIIEGLLKSQTFAANTIYALGHHIEKTKKMAQTLGIQAASGIEELAQSCTTIVIGVKPNVVESVLKQLKPLITNDTLIISIAAGLTLEQLGSWLGGQHKIARVMPNTPVLVREGVSAIAVNEQITESDLNVIKAMFGCLGKAEVVAEYLIHAVIGVSGSSPAYIYMLIEAMADAAVLGGMARQQAYTFAAQAVLGSAKMVLETGMHPAQLKDMVCSPGGTTIEAVTTLEAKGFRAAVIEAIKSCMDKSVQMSKQ